MPRDRFDFRGFSPAHTLALLVLLAAFTAANAAETTYDPLEDYEELIPSTDVVPPETTAGDSTPATERGEYLVQLLGCSTCHTDGALIGEPNRARWLAGSGVGIAYSNPLRQPRPGIVYPPNLTPDDDTGLGQWSDEAIAEAIRSGDDRHSARPLSTIMPWAALGTLTDEDVAAIVAYLRSVPPVRHPVPQNVSPGARSFAPFVHFGVYRSRGEEP